MKNYLPTNKYFIRLYLFTSILAVFIFHLPASAQWKKTGGPAGISVKSLFDDGSFLYAGTANKGIYRSDDHGNSWSHASAGIGSVQTICFTKDDAALYAGTTIGVYYSSDNGSTWIAGGDGNPQLVTCMTTGDGYVFAGTSFKGVFKSADHGLTWTSANGGQLDGFAISAMTYSNHTLVVDENQTTAISNDLGNSWTIQTNSPTLFFPIVNLISTGDTVLASANNGIFYSFDGAVTWSPFIMIDRVPLEVITGLVFNNGSVYAGAPSGMFQSNDFGVTWRTIKSNGLRRGSGLRFVSGFTASGNNFLFGMDELGIMLSKDIGKNWNQSIKGFNNASNIDNALLAIDDSMWTGVHTDGIYKTPDNGKTWRKVSTGDLDDSLSNAVVFGLLNPAPHTILAATCDAGLYRSDDDGATWIKSSKGLPVDAPGIPSCIFCIIQCAGNILVGTTQGVFYSTDLGLTWHASNLKGFDHDIQGLAVNGDTVIAGMTSLEFPEGIYISSDSGLTWQHHQTIPGIDCLVSDGIDHFYVGTFINGNWRSTNNGLTFTRMLNGLQPSSPGFCIKVVDVKNVFIGNEAGIFYSNDQGDHFTKFNKGFDTIAPVQGLQANSSYLFAGTFQNAIWRIPLTNFGISKEQALSNSNVPSQIAVNVNPNPFSNETRAQIYLPVDGRVSINIYDITGRIVFSDDELAQRGDFERIIHLNQAPGIYLMNIRFGNQSLNEKLVIAN